MRSLRGVVLAGVLSSFVGPLWGQKGPWVFAGFKGNSEDGVYFAVSTDGYKWRLVNEGKPVLPPEVKGELMRDPFLQRGPDGKFAMVWTWGWRDHTIGYAASADLLHWGLQRQLAVMANEPGALNVWAPAMYWEAKEKRWLIFWSSTIPGRFPGDDVGGWGVESPDMVYDYDRFQRVYAGEGLL